MCQLRADGLNQGAIAQALGISIPTLLLNYPAELRSKSQAAARRRRRDRGDKEAAARNASMAAGRIAARKARMHQAMSKARKV